MCGLSGRRRITIGADSLRSEMQDGSIRVIDVRRKEEYSKGHIPSSVNLPLADLLANDGPERASKLFGSLGIDDEVPVTIYDDTFGALASRVAWALEYLGHGDVSLLDVTFDGWKSLGLEYDTKQPDIRPSKHSARMQPEILASAKYLEESKGNKGAVLLDNRERLNYLEQHIPGAISVSYRSLASSNHILRPPDEMRRLFENRGIRPDSEVITYCGSVGTLSGLAYYALKSAKIPRVRLYVRSFKEWKKLEKPIEKQADAHYWDLSAE